jgi:hypothetical protein
MDTFNRIVTKNTLFVETTFGTGAIYNPPSPSNPYGSVLCIKCKVQTKLQYHGCLEGFSKKGLDRINFVKKHIIKQSCPVYCDFLEEKQST